MLTKCIRLCAQRAQKLRAICIVSHHFHDDGSKLVRGTSLMEVKEVLKTHEIAFRDEHACIISNCPICANEKTKDSKVYINKATGNFMCDTCMRSGSWNTLQRFFDQFKNPVARKELDALRLLLPVQKDFSEKWQTLHKKHTTVKNLNAFEYQHILNLFNIPEIPQEEMSQMNCIYDNDLGKIYFPLLAFHKRVVGYKSFSVDSVEETMPRFGSSGMVMYKKRNSKLDSTAIVVHTIEDLLALISHKTANVIICLPHNMQHLPQELLPSLEHFQRLTLWFGNEEASWDTARHFAKKLGEKRCFYVRPTVDQPRPKLAADLGYDLKDIGHNAKPIHHESITTFHSLRHDVLSDLQNIEKVEGVKWKRFPTLNRILKGHRKGEFTVLTGPTGCGKTTFVSEYSLDLAMQGVNTLWGSFEIRNSRLARTMLQQLAGVPLHENLATFDTYANAFEKLPIYFMTFHGQQNIRVVMDAVEHATYVHDIAHVIIDNVQFMMGVMDMGKHADRFWDQDRIVAAFRAFATQFNCHVTLVIHPRKERDENMLTTSSIFGSAKASQESDNVLIIQDKTLTSIRGKKYLQVAKNRYSGDLGVMALEFDKARLSFAQKTKPAKDVSTSEKDLYLDRCSEVNESHEEDTNSESDEESVERIDTTEALKALEELETEEESEALKPLNASKKREKLKTFEMSDGSEAFDIPEPAESSAPLETLETSGMWTIMK